MQSIPRNVILDLLPAYIAGEASAESRSLIEEFARNDADIAKMIRTETLEPEEISKKISPADELEMKTIKNLRSRIRRRMWYVAGATTLILMIPLIAMMFTDEVNWKVFDFLVMATLLMGAGVVYLLISGSSKITAYRAGAGVAVIAGLLLIWMNLAVGGLIKIEVANLMYVSVLIIAIIGAIAARFKAAGMAKAMFATAAAQLLVTVIVLIGGFVDPASPITGILVMNGFFVVLFGASALLFRKAARQQHPADADLN